MSYCYYNANPRGAIVGDCVKRALKVVENRDYMEIQRELNAIKRQLGAQQFNSDPVLSKYMKEHGYVRVTYPAIAGKSRMTVGEFADSHPTGSYVLQAASHWVGCVDGVVYDTFNSLNKCCYSSYEYNALAVTKSNSKMFTIRDVINNTTPSIRSGIYEIERRLVEGKPVIRVKTGRTVLAIFTVNNNANKIIASIESYIK